MLTQCVAVFDQCVAIASSVIDSYPDEPEKYPTFKCLKTVLRGMRSGDFIVHPFTMEMLSSLDKYVCVYYICKLGYMHMRVCTCVCINLVL